METVLKKMSPDVREGAKVYIAKKEIPQLFECITTGLLHHRPENTVLFVQECLDEVKNKPSGFLRWNTFIDWKPSEEAMKTPPASREGSARKLLRSSLSDRPKSRLTPMPALHIEDATLSNGSSEIHRHSQHRVQVASASNVRESPAAVQSFP